MTWEWVVIISVIIICATVFCSCVLITSEGAVDMTAVDGLRKEFLRFKDEVAPMMIGVFHLEKQAIETKALAEETKKMMSQVNLAVGFKPQKMQQKVHT